jgi:hypothetical protein
MNVILSGALGAGLLAAIAVVASGQEPADRLAEVKTAAMTPRALEAYRLQFAGAEQACTVERGTIRADGSSTLLLDPECEKQYPRLAAARFWREKADGTVTFIKGDGSVVFEFGVSDGAAYESFEPGAPLISLTALN